MKTPEIDPDWIASMARDLAGIRKCRETAPLTTVIAWHSDQTSQRDALAELQSRRTLIVAGGNRSGKTYLLRAVLVALVLGSDHPHARLFWEQNGCDPDAFPRGPGEGYIVALSSNDSRRYHREDVAELLPHNGNAPTCKWYNRKGKGEASVEITVPGYDKPAIVWFKSEDQGAKGIQGDAVRAILHDEEGATADVWSEAAIRLIDENGYHLMANTPLNGRTWLWRKYVRQTPPDVAYREIWSEDNPYLPADAVERLSKSDKASARTRGKWEVAEGLVFPSWSRSVHVCSRARWRTLYPDIPWPKGAREPDIPADWPRFRIQNFGTVNPGCVQWWTLCPEGRRILYRQLYRAGWSSKAWARAIIAAEGGDSSADDPAQWTDTTETITRACADPAAAQQILDMRRTYGVRYRKARKDWGEGRTACTEALAPQSDGLPGVLVLAGVAPAFTTEIEGYRYLDKETATRARDEKPVKKDDHAMDTFRYGMVLIRRWAR